MQKITNKLSSINIIYFYISISSVYIFYALDISSLILLSSIFCFLFAIFLTRSHSNCGFYSITVTCLLTLLVYSISVPLHNFSFMDYDEKNVNYALILCINALLGMTLGYMTLKREKYHKRRSNRTDLTFGLTIFILGTIVFILSIYLTVGIEGYIGAGYAGRSLIKRESGPIELGLYYVITGYLFIVYHWLFSPVTKARSWLPLFLISSLVILVTFVSFIGIRRPSFFMVISSLFLYFLKKREKIPVKIALLSLSLICLFGLFANFRQVLSDHGIDDTLSYISTHFDFTWFDFSITELGAPFRALLDTINMQFSEGLLYGQSFLDGLIYLVPSSILTPKETLSVQYTHHFFSKQFISIGGNMGFFSVAEGFLNLGPIGPFVEFYFIGIILKYIENKALKDTSVLSAITYAIIVPWFFFFIRTDFSSFLKSFFYSVIPVYLAYFIYKNILRKNSHFKIPNKEPSFI